MRIVQGWRLSAFAFALACGCTDQSAPPVMVGPGSREVAAAPRGLSVAIPTDCPGGAVPKEPVEYGVCHLELALARAGSSAKVNVAVATDPAAAAALAASGVQLGARSESYVILPEAQATQIIGRDPAGAMYGALDVAERLGLGGTGALPLHAPVVASPTVTVRAANPFLTLPTRGEPIWWFDDPKFWTEFLDMMARGRLNFLDMHAMYNPENTKFPNALLWFATSPSFPQLGVPREQREANLAMLEAIVQMAHARGIQVGLMSYRSDLNPLAEKDEPAIDEPQLDQYTREAVADLVTRTPGLSYFGFRVGESKRPASWFLGTYIAGLQASHTGVRTYSRSWLTSKQSLLPVFQASVPNSIVEVKYNGEQLGPPYIIAGGNMKHWASYSYEDYLSPPDPYRFVFQIRAAGTHRIFRYSSYERTARTVKSLAISPKVEGFTYEAPHSYLFQRDVYHVNPADSYSPWTFRRDELGYMLFGRLGYDPATPSAVFQGMLRDRVGTSELWDAVQAASDIVPWIQTANTCGPDQRSYAPELELGGPVGYWAAETHAPSPLGKNCVKGHAPFDTFAVAMPHEAAEDLVAGRGTPRLSPVDIAQIVLANAKVARTASQVKIDPANAEARDYVRECIALADLGEWFGHKLRSATALAVYERSASAEWLEAARSEIQEADAAFTRLASDTSYIPPFEEPMRMGPEGLKVFHWKEELRFLPSDPESIDVSVENVRARPPHAQRPLPHAKAWLDAPRGLGPGLADLSFSPKDPRAPAWSVAVTLANAAPTGAHVNVLYRPFPSNAADWVALPATGAGTAWKATVPGTGEGVMFAVEIVGGQGQAFRYPDVRTETPYRALAP